MKKHKIGFFAFLAVYLIIEQNYGEDFRNLYKYFSPKNLKDFGNILFLRLRKRSIR